MIPIDMELAEELPPPEENEEERHELENVVERKSGFELALTLVVLPILPNKGGMNLCCCAKLGLKVKLSPKKLPKKALKISSALMSPWKCCWYC